MTGPGAVFCYGTLLHPPVFRAVTGLPLKGHPARLEGFRCRRVQGEPYPAIVPDPTSQVEGLWVPIPARPVLEALDEYEGPLYQRIRVRVACEQGFRAAWVYQLRPVHRQRLSNEPWTLEKFRREWAGAYPGAGF